MQRTPLEVVLAADVERSLLLSEAASLQEAEVSDAARLAEVLESIAQSSETAE